jgi:hypothetical protein
VLKNVVHDEPDYGPRLPPCRAQSAADSAQPTDYIAFVRGAPSRDRDPSAGTGLSFEATLVGVAEHNAYHGGQIALLKRAARARASGRSS